MTICSSPDHNTVRPPVPRPRVLLIADYPGWIFERHARTLQAQLADELDIDIAYLGDTFEEAAYDLVHPLEWNLVPEGMPRQPFKWVAGIRSHVSWEGQDLPAFCRNLRGWFSRTYAVSARLQAIFRPELPDIVRLPHGVDTEHFRPSAPPPALESSLRVGWAGNREASVKGFEQFILPLGDLPGVRLVVCGYADRLLGFDEMRGFYDSIDVYVCASLNEGHNNSLLEAAAMERAIVTTDVGTVPEFLIHEQSALIVPREPEAFRHAIERLRSDPDSALGWAERPGWRCSNISNGKPGWMTTAGSSRRPWPWPNRPRAPRSSCCPKEARAGSSWSLWQRSSRHSRTRIR